MDVVALSLAKAEARRVTLPTPLDLRRDFGLTPSMSASFLGTKINDAVTAAISGARPLSLGRDAWPVDVPIVIPDAMTLSSEGIYGDFGSQNYSGSLTNAAQPLIGGRIVQTSPGADGIVITAAARPVHLHDIGVEFHSSIAYLNTGTGIRTLPPNRDGQTYPRHGVFYGRWNNLWVQGHDGNHYAFDLTNAILCELRGLFATGGGGLHITNNSPAYNYGNHKIQQTSFSVVAGGTAHGVSLDGPSGILNFISMDRVGVFVGGTAPGATTPTSAQKTLAYSGSVTRNMLSHCSFESSVGSTAALLPNSALGGGNYGIVVSTPENFAAGAITQNQSGTNYLMMTTVTLNPTGAAAATAYVEVSQSASMTSPVELARVTAPLGDIAGRQQILTFSILTDYRYYRVTCVNATINYSRSIALGTVKVP